MQQLLKPYNSTTDNCRHWIFNQIPLPAVPRHGSQQLVGSAKQLSKWEFFWWENICPRQGDVLGSLRAGKERDSHRLFSLPTIDLNPLMRQAMHFPTSEVGINSYFFRRCGMIRTAVPKLFDGAPPTSCPGYLGNSWSGEKSLEAVHHFSTSKKANHSDFLGELLSFGVGFSNFFLEFWFCRLRWVTSAFIGLSL